MLSKMKAKEAMVSFALFGAGLALANKEVDDIKDSAAELFDNNFAKEFEE